MKDVPYIAFESEMVRLERIIKRMFVLILVLVVLLFGSNAGWLWYESQFEDVKTEVMQELDSGDGGDAIINDGVHINDGESETEGDRNSQSSQE